MKYQDISMPNDECKCVCGQAAAVICNATRFTTYVDNDGTVRIFLSYLADNKELDKKDHVMLIFNSKDAVTAMINSLKLAEKHFDSGLDVDDLLDNQGKDGFNLLQIG